MAAKISINRAPVLTLWAAIVAERSGFDRSAALTLGRGLAGLNAQSKGRRLGIYEESKEKPKAKGEAGAGVGHLESVKLLGREIPVVHTAQGLRASNASSEGKGADPGTVQAYLEQKFGDSLDEARAAMESLANAFSPAELETQGFALYEKFRPQIPEGRQGWGAKGVLDLNLVRRLAK